MFSAGTEPAGFGCSVKRAGPRLGRRSLYMSLLPSKSTGDCRSDGGVATPPDGEDPRISSTDNSEGLQRGELLKLYFEESGSEQPVDGWGRLRHHLRSLTELTIGWAVQFRTYSTGRPTCADCSGKQCTREEKHTGMRCSQGGLEKTLLLSTEAGEDAGACAKRFWKRPLAAKRKNALVLLPLCAVGVFLFALTLLWFHAEIDKEGQKVDRTEHGADGLRGITQEAALLQHARHSEQNQSRRQPEERVAMPVVSRHLPAALRTTGNTAHATVEIHDEQPNVVACTASSASAALPGGGEFARISLRRQRQPVGSRETGDASILLSAEMLHQLMLGMAVHQKKVPMVEAEMPQALTPLRTDVVIRDFMNTQYVIEVGLGTPQQTLHVIADTGSSDFWACSEKCGIFCMLHKVYAHSKSSTYQPDNSPYNVTYIGGPVSGFLSVDNVSVGDLMARQVLFAEADNVKGLGTAFFFGHFDGVMGMGLPATSTHGLKPLMQTAIEQQLLKKWVFAFYLSSDDSVDGELTLGGYDSDRVDGSIVYSPLVDKRYWMINSQGMRVKETVVSNTTKVIVDSGTSLLAGPLDEVDRIAHMFGAFSLPMLPKGTYVISCDEALTLEDLVLVIEGSKFTVSARDLVIKISDIKGVPCLFGMIGLQILEGKAHHKVSHHGRLSPAEKQQLNAAPQQAMERQGSLLSRLLAEEAALTAAEDQAPPQRSAQAALRPGAYAALPPVANTADGAAVSVYDAVNGIEPLTGIGRLWIFGDVFMRGVYTIFDYDQKRIGFAKLKVKTANRQKLPRMLQRQ